MAGTVRTLHVYSGNLWGGIETFLVTLARNAAAAPEWESEFALCFDARLRRELAGAGAAVHDLGEVRLRSPLGILRARRRLREIIDRGRFDVVVCHAAWCQALFGSVAGPATLRVFWLHDGATGKGRFERLARLSRPGFCVANSEYTQATLSTLYPALPSTVQYYPIETTAAALTTDERRAVRQELGASDGEVVVIQASRMEPWKGQRRLLAALARVDRALPWVAVLVGGAQRPVEREYVTSLERQCEELGIRARVRFLGQRSDVTRLLAASDVHCQPNQGPEPFGIVFVEALAAGLPLVTFAFGGPREIVTPDVGILVDDDRALSDALGRLIADRELRQRLGGAGPARARALCEPRTRIPAIHETLRRALATHARRG
jgi:glycosyltransferase involved in cell wall biosynthesis